MKICMNFALNKVKESLEFLADYVRDKSEGYKDLYYDCLITDRNSIYVEVQGSSGVVYKTEISNNFLIHLINTDLILYFQICFQFAHIDCECFKPLSMYNKV